MVGEGKDGGGSSEQQVGCSNLKLILTCNIYNYTVLQPILHLHVPKARSLASIIFNYRCHGVGRGRERAVVTAVFCLPITGTF